MRKMSGSPGHFAISRRGARAEIRAEEEDPGGGHVCPRAEDRFPDRQRQVMASPAMGSQAYRFTGWGKTSLDYVSRSVREGPGSGDGEGKFSRSLMVTSIG